MEKQIAQLMNAWVEDWNESRTDDLTKLYYAHADLLPADGSRASGQGEIRAFLEKQVGTKMEMHSPGIACFNDKDVPGVAIENGTYKQSGAGKPVEGNHLVVLSYLQVDAREPRWVIAQQALTAKP